MRHRDGVPRKDFSTSAALLGLGHAFLPVPVRNRNRSGTNPLAEPASCSFAIRRGNIWGRLRAAIHFHQMSPVTLMLLIVAVIVLLPIVPAFLLFKFLPSRADASGPLQGLEIKLGGAFAGYFILVVLILSQLTRLKEIASPEPQVWKVTGTVQDSHASLLAPPMCRSTPTSSGRSGAAHSRRRSRRRRRPRALVSISQRCRFRTMPNMPNPFN